MKRELLLVSADELPDWVPYFGRGSVRSDPEGNLWIRRLESVDGRPVYDVVNRRGELVARITLPPGRVIAGFGEAGTVFMVVAEDAGVRIEKARYH